MFKEASNLNCQFRQSIRNRHISQLFKARRKQLMEEQQIQFYHWEQFVRICREASHDQKSFQKEFIIELTKFIASNRNLEDIDVIALQKKLIQQFFGSRMNSNQQKICANILTHLTYKEDIGNIFNAYFVQGMFEIITLSEPAFQELCLALIYNIVHNCDINTILTNLGQPPNTNIIDCLLRTLNHDTVEVVYREALRIYLLLIKKIRKPEYLKLSNFKDHLLKGLNKFRDIQSLIITLLCFNNILNIQPLSSSSNDEKLISTILSKTQPQYDSRLSIHTTALTNSILLLCSHSYTQKQVKTQILPYLLAILSPQTLQKVCQVLYEIVKLNKNNTLLLLHDYSTLFEQLAMIFVEGSELSQTEPLILLMGVVILQAGEQISAHRKCAVKAMMDQVLRRGILPREKQEFLEEIFQCCQ